MELEYNRKQFAMNKLRDWYAENVLLLLLFYINLEVVQQ